MPVSAPNTIIWMAAMYIIIHGILSLQGYTPLYSSLAVSITLSGSSQT